MERNYTLILGKKLVFEDVLSLVSLSKVSPFALKKSFAH